MKPDSTAPVVDCDEDLVVSIDEIGAIRDRFETEHSDGGSTGRSDGPGGDGFNYPAER